MTTADLLDGLIRREGGFVDDVADRGGATKYGITAATLGQWRGLHRAATRDEVRALEESEARAIYEARYIRQPGFEAIEDEALRALVVDIGVNSGTATATRFLQQALGVFADGVLGPATRAALATHPNPRAVFVHVWRRRQRLYLDLALKEPAVVGFLAAHPEAKLKFLDGWLTRNAEFVT